MGGDASIEQDFGYIEGDGYAIDTWDY